MDAIDYSDLVSKPTGLAGDPRSRIGFRHLEYSGVETHYDDYLCSGCYGCDTGDDYCRGSKYYGLRIDHVNPQEVLDGIFGKNSVPFPNLIIAKFDLGSKDSYYFETWQDYYGEEFHVHLSDSIAAELANEWHSWPNANDKDGIYQYLASKGQRILGKTPLENLKLALTQENGRPNKLVDSATKVNRSNVQLRTIKVPNAKHYNEVAPREIPKGGIGGVLVKSGREKILVDGYHRLKWLRSKGRKSCQFLVLS